MAHPHRPPAQFCTDHPGCWRLVKAFRVTASPVDLKTVHDLIDRRPNGNKEISLNFITPPEVGQSTHVQRQSAHAHVKLRWPGDSLQLRREERASIADNDRVELLTPTALIAARARGGQPARLAGHGAHVPPKKKIINTPGSEITNTRAGIHNR